ncbi:MAG: elongation factor P [Dethiosulfovibrio peptidovorans]|nr:MAG: elongation factor P [Dethiosulfovibrio peptidovorans]
MAQVVDTSKFYPGIKIVWQDGLWEVVEFQHHKMGRGGAVIKTKLKNLDTGTIIENAFRSGEKFDRIIFDERPAQFLYQDGESYVFMDMVNYDQIYLSSDMLSRTVSYLTDNLEVTLQMYGERIMGIDLPNSVVLKIIETSPNFKGDTASGGGKPATTETGLTVTVPMFVENGEDIVVDTRTGAYLERAKK